MGFDSLFNPGLTSVQAYGSSISNLYCKLAYCPKDEKINELTYPIEIGKIPFVLHICGIPSGIVSLIPVNVPHMIGFGQEKTDVSYRNIHNLSLEELLAIPSMVADPDMVFRSNTMPNSSLVLCREVEGRGNPVVIAMRVEVKDALDSSGIIVSGYEKDRRPREFFSNLYRYGYCIYDGERSGFFSGIKTGSGARGRLPGPIPASAVTYTDPSDKYLTSEGISPTDTLSIATKSSIVKRYNNNSTEIIAIFSEKQDTAMKAERNLNELGYHTMRPNSLKKTELQSLLKSCTGIACDKDMIPIFSKLREKSANIRKIGQAIDFMPDPIFKTKLLPLAMATNLGRQEREKTR